jgi:uncharacterized membrane protein
MMTSDRAFTITRTASLLGGGMLAGIALTVLVLELALRQLDGPQYVHVRQAEFGYLTWFIGAILVPTLVAVAMLVVLARKDHRRTLLPAAVALALLLLAVVVTLFENGPVNIEQLAWNAQAPPAEWASVRDRWQIAHAVRTVAIVLALGCLAVPDRPHGASPWSGNVGGRS